MAAMAKIVCLCSTLVFTAWNSLWDFLRLNSTR